MKLFTALAAVVLGASAIAAQPASAQYYGNGYGYNNNTQNDYGYNPYARSRGPQIDLNGWQPSSDFQRQNNNRPSGCSSFSMSSSCY